MSKHSEKRRWLQTTKFSSNSDTKLRASDEAAAKRYGNKKREEGTSNLSAKSAGVLGVLADFDLLHLLAQRGTITSTVFSHDSNLNQD